MHRFSFWLLLFGCIGSLLAQAPGVPIYEEPGEDGVTAEEAALLVRAAALRTKVKLLALPAIEAQSQRRSCSVELPNPKKIPLDGVATWRVARNAYVRIGYCYLCGDCDEWHLDLAGGYSIAADGIVATSQHVIDPSNRGIKEGYLVCVDEQGEMHAVEEILACNPITDVAIVRTAAVGLQPLPLRVEVFPGEAAHIYSDPMSTRGYFSTGIVNRFLREKVPGTKATRVVMNVSTEWAPGSSGAAVLDAFGNAIGHVAAIATHGDEDGQPTEPAADGARASAGWQTFMVLHYATRAQDVLALVKPKEVPR
jgi:hypothetical protein